MLKTVKTILEEDERARNSDSFLYFRIIEKFGMQQGFDVNQIPVASFLLNMSQWGFPNFESVRRSRQKVQAEYPELAACKKIENARVNNEKEYKAFAMEGVKHG